jgi:hypothetical protein
MSKIKLVCAMKKHINHLAQFEKRPFVFVIS